MKAILSTAAALLVLSGTAVFAENDAAAGEKDFKKCKACHAIVSPDGEAIVKGGKTGPNLYGVVGRQAGTDPEFKRYSDTIVKLGEEGLVWTPELLAEYIPDAKAFLKEHSGDAAAKTSMTPQKLKDPTDVVAYLESVAAE